MQFPEHPLDKYIATFKADLDALPADHLEVEDTEMLQRMCLEKFANSQGYVLADGLFQSDNPAYQTTTLNNMVALYNNTMQVVGEQIEGNLFVETVYLSGRNFRNRVVVQQHKVKFL